MDRLVGIPGSEVRRFGGPWERLLGVIHHGTGWDRVLAGVYPITGTWYIVRGTSYILSPLSFSIVILILILIANCIFSTKRDVLKRYVIVMFHSGHLSCFIVDIVCIDGGLRLYRTPKKPAFSG